MINKGILAVNKPSGWTSFDVCNKLKSVVWPNKIGHLGTLDPMATGVLLVTIGKATKLFDIAQQKIKTYIAEFEFGYTTDTLDATGTVIEKTEIIPTLDAIERVIPQFVGDIMQLPPKYSAKSIGGARAYDLARQGKEFELTPKEVHINSIKLITYQNNVLKLEITCGSGTYIRSLARDIADSVGSKACMISLVRTSIGSVNLDACFDIVNVGKITNEMIEDNIIPIEKVLNLKIVELDTECTKRLLNGQIVHAQYDDGEYLLKRENCDLAIINIKNFNAKMKICLE